MSMMLLISSRIIFTFSDVSEFGKEVVAVLLIIFLVMVFLRTLGQKFHRRWKRNEPCLVTPELIKSLEKQDRMDLGDTVLTYYMYRMRAMEIDFDFALQSKSSHILVRGKRIPAEIRTENANTLAVHVNAISLTSIEQFQPDSSAQVPKSPNTTSQ
jgi:hypothetical protein